MGKVLVSVYSWESPRLYASEAEIAKGEKVIVSVEHGNELGIVEEADIETKEDPQEKIMRVATERDRSVHEEYKKKKNDLIKACKKEVKNSGLGMKIIDAMISLDGKQIIFAFTADGRVDFRDLVKNLSGQFRRSVRMQQIGSRDEAKKLGGYGICGRELCCVRSNGSLQSITTEMARVQQISHRGTERISGLCGRLMCCLAYEAEQYREMLKGMPEPYSTVKTSKGKGTVIEINAVLQNIKVKLETGEYITVKKEEIK